MISIELSWDPVAIDDVSVMENTKGLVWNLGEPCCNFLRSLIKDLSFLNYIH